ncbi:MAG: glycine betaine ABC transporter substrate-binding protein [Nannocystaceae bacterium]
MPERASTSTTTMGPRLWALLAVLLALLGHRAASAGPVEEPSHRQPQTLVIGSKNFTESRLLAEIMAQLIEAHTDLRVERRVNLGGTTVVFAALRSGEIDLYPEYTGTGWTVQLQRSDRVANPLRAFLAVQHAFEERWDLHWLDPFGFSNGYALAMPLARAQALGITRISDLQAHADALRLGFSHEFLERDDGYPGLARAYGLQLPQPRGMEHGLAYQALAQGELDVVDTYTTDGKLQRYPVRLLQDDREFFPPYDAAPVLRGSTLRAHPSLVPLLRRLAFTLPDDRMRALNYEVEEGQRDFADVARQFLLEQGLLDSEASTAPDRGRGDGLAAMLWARRGETLRRVGEHLTLTGIAMLLAIALAVPLGLWLSRHERWAGPVIGATGVIQTIPSLALLALMIPIPGLGLGRSSAVVALLLYALLPIVRNTYAGIREVDPDLVEAARGMGLTDGQILRLVELPLAVRTIMAGVRTSTIISIGVATLAAFIGAGGLGDPIVTGLQLNDTGLILSGALPAALLAVVTDALLGVLERQLVPRGLRAGRSGAAR